MDLKTIWEGLEKTGEAEVRKKLASGCYGPSKIPIIEEWLKDKEQERTNQVHQRQEAREEAALEIASEANDISRKSNRISIGSFIVSGLSLVLAIVALIISLQIKKP